MNATKLTILLSCVLSAMTCSATKYQIKALNTPTIIIDNRQAKVGDWFDDTSVISWTKENQAMRVLSDENKVYTLSAKLYKEAKAKKFSDFIAYTKPLAVRGAKDDSLIAQLQERFDQDFIMLDEIIIDLSGIDLPEGCVFKFDSNQCTHSIISAPTNKIIRILRSSIEIAEGKDELFITFEVKIQCAEDCAVLVNDSLEINVLPLN